MRLSINFTRITQITILGAIIAAGFFVYGGNALAIGLITEPIVVKDVLRGQEIEESLSILNTFDTPVRVGLTAEGDIRDWAFFYPLRERDGVISELTLSGKERRGVAVIFKVPEDTPNGEYTGSVSVTTIADETSTTTTAVLQRIPREVSISVTDVENVTLRADIFTEELSVELGSLMPLRVQYTNEGNISLRPELHLKLIQAENIVYNAILPFPDNEEDIKPLEDREIVVEAPTNGAVLGKLRVEAQFKYNGELLGEKTFRVTAVEPGSIKKDSKTDSVVSNNLVKYGGFGVLLIIVLGIFMYVGKWNRNITEKPFKKKKTAGNKSAPKTRKKKK